MKVKNLFRKTNLLLSLIFIGTVLHAQTRPIKGTVRGEDGETLPGVSVVEKGTTNGTITNVDGVFSLSVSSKAKALVLSYIGMKTQEVDIANRAEINVTLQKKTIGVDEVVVVGYGVQKKSDVISSVVSVKPEKMTKNATLDVGEMLRGKAAGVMVTTSNAGPGGSSNILIRGKGSINGGNNPLIIADGVPIGAINDINPEDIASVEVLKDAAAQAIYGAQAANGVILITTKRGKAGQLKINYNGYYGTQSVDRNFDVYNGAEFATLKREADRAVNNNIMRSDNHIFSDIELKAIAEGRSIDWSKEVLKNASIQNHDLSFSAGTEKTKLYVGMNYQDQNGVVPTTNFQKATLRVNLDQKMTNWLKLGLNTSFQISEGNGPSVAYVLRQPVTASPLGNIYNPDGTYNVRPSGNQENFNPLLDLAEQSDEKHNRNDILNVFLDISPIKGLNNRINASRRSWNYKELQYATRKSSSGYSSGYGSGRIAYKENVEYLLEDILTYDKTIHDHHINLTAVGSIDGQNYYDFYNSASQEPNDILGIYGLESALKNVPSIGGNKRRLVSAVGRIQYDYATKYYVTLSARMDGSSVFGADNKWGTFPAVALGWNIYKENFLKDVSSLTNLKLRASYGSVGNEAIAPYGSLSLASQLDYLFGDQQVSGYAPGSTLSNPHLKWETSTTLNLALDFGLWRNRLSGTVELYKTNTKDLLVNRQLNASIGYSSMPDNIGEVQNKGIEVNLDAVPVKSNDLTVHTGLTFSMNKNEIISLYGDLNGDGIQDDDVANNWFIGQPIEVYKRPKFIGIWQGTEVYPGSKFNPSTGQWEINGQPAPVATDPATNLPIIDPNTGKTPVPGTVKLADINHDGKIDAQDNVLTSKYPKWMGSFYLNASYKGFDFSADVYTVQGITKDNLYLYDYTYGGDLRGLFNGIKVDYWTPENPSNAFPQPNAGNTPVGMPSIGLQDASYWRLQNVTLGYTLPKKLISKIKLDKVRVYCTGQNLITSTKYQSFSPEQDLSAYPTTRNIIFGVQVGL